ncbi:MAG: undecaprenyldiphospho-muramoylpentapeptide beta-N-acetylglucosaminyltransferase [Syntrophomonadaceae bacterium]|jgi:UDP-N-acetylglucosamine--N-acetylmuramyl-(pentapeptide) pyrophosphoryl-undecaprenol N-acetylglucosamine transferase|nr:undecaprenyldiphospho-muramoylpentapeptide beta-N-acetylglucosaminyltransferase [Syntrophomonadaceae bacterium]
MKVILTGGGTGGHIYPALAIAEGLKGQPGGADILYVGAKKGMENTLVPKAGLNFQTIDVSGINRVSVLKAAWALSKFPFSIRQAWDIVKKFEPDVVLGTGGYVSFPVVLAASYRAGCKTFIHETNAKMGLANRKLTARVDCNLLAFEEAAPMVSPHKFKVTGSPVRKEIMDIYYKRKNEPFDFKNQPFNIIVFGGSRGAGSINRAMMDLLDRYANEDFQITWVTGAVDYEQIKRAVERRWGSKLRLNLKLFPYLYEMGAALAASKLAVCRAGASTLSEIALLGLPAILVPFPYASDNHQEKNARALKEKNVVEMIIDEFLDGNTLYNMIESLRYDEQKMQDMRENLLKEAKPNALDDIIAAITDS